MLALRDTWLIQIEITNVCNHRCANCTRFVGHHKKPYFMELGEIERAIDSLEGYPGGIGIMGGEPLMHPKFAEICALVQKKVHRDKRFLWTSGYKWDTYRTIVRKTFAENIYYNDHKETGQTHQPILIAIDDVLEDAALKRKLIDKCWIQEKWSPSINPQGGFFCEVAAAMAKLLQDVETPSAFAIEKGWWQKSVAEYEEQIKKYCYRCSAALPMPDVPNTAGKDSVSPSNFELLKKVASPKYLENKVEIFDKKFSRDEVEEIAKTWRPWEYLGDEGKIDYDRMYGKFWGRVVKLKKKINKRKRKLKKFFAR